LTEADIQKAKNLVSVVSALSSPVKSKIGQAIAQHFFNATGERPSKASISRYLRHIPNNSESGPLLARFYVQRLASCFKNADLGTADLGRRAAIDDILSGKPMSWSELPIERSKGRVRALYDLLGIRESQIQADRYIVSDETHKRTYFGYRRSTTKGDIIRFFLRVSKAKESDLLTFENRYIRDENQWLVRGFGFTVDTITYLIGHATQLTGPERSLGLRCFALVGYRQFDHWFTGPILSVAGPGQPISARVLLVPAEHHTPELLAGGDPENLTGEQIHQSLGASTAPHDLDRTIVLKINGQNAFDPVKASTYIQSAIWNGTFTTLRANTGIPNVNSQSSFLSVLQMQEALLPLVKNTRDLNAPFFHLAGLSYDLKGGG
jgi:hypothetical protein